MTPQEKDLIQCVFDRLAQSGVGTKDPEAAALIGENMRRIADAPYGLVQAVVALEAGLSHANERINALQSQLADVRARDQGGSFLAGGGPWGGGSVPRAGAGAPAPAAGLAPQAAYAPPASGMGGFLRNAATMAAGVAGGTLIAEGLSSLFGGHRYGGGYGGVGGFAGGSPWGGSPAGVVENVTVNNYYDNAPSPQAADTAQDSGGFADATYDDSSAAAGDWDNDFGGTDGTDI
jgi:hypothetical protein